MLLTIDQDKLIYCQVNLKLCSYKRTIKVSALNHACGELCVELASFLCMFLHGCFFFCFFCGVLQLPPIV